MLGIPTQVTIGQNAPLSMQQSVLRRFLPGQLARDAEPHAGFGLRYEFEDGINESEDRWITGFDPDCQLAITDLAQAAYARNPIPQVAVSDFRVLGGSVYAGAVRVLGKTWKGESMWMPRFSAGYKLGEKTVDQRRIWTLLRHAERRRLQRRQPDRLQRDDDERGEHGLRPDLASRRSRNGVSPIVDPFPVRATAAGSSRRSPIRSARTRSSARASTARIRTASTRACSAGGSACSGSCSAPRRSKSRTAARMPTAWTSHHSRIATCPSRTTAGENVRDTSARR